MNFSTKKISQILIKIFLIGLLLQFFFQTFITYKLNLNGIFRDIFWMRKEIILIILTGMTIRGIHKQNLRKQIRQKIPIKTFCIIFITTLSIAFISSVFINSTGLGSYIVSIKYSMIGFFIFILFFLQKFLDSNHSDISLINRYGSIIKKILRGALIRRAIIWTIPRVLEFVGYDQYTYEGTINSAPPATYYTQYDHGYVRNQFLFERPISLGFFLIALWPLFFMLYIRNRGYKAVFGRGLLYSIIIISTFSRAAWIARFAQTFILIFLQYRKNILKTLIYGIFPLLLIFGIITYLGKDQIISRNFSNTGHIKMTLEAITKLKQKPIRGYGAGIAGPASYQIGGGQEYNPENQYLQIRLEYGFLGFLGRLVLYLYLHKIGYNSYQETIDPKTLKQKKYFAYLVLAFSLGILGLSIEGLVLHSFVDRMIVYPFMALFGIMFATYKLQDKN